MTLPRRLFAEIARRPLARGTTILLLTIVFVAAALLALVGRGLDTVAARHERLVVTLDLVEGVAPARSTALVAMLGRLPAIEEVRLLTPADRFSRMRAALADRAATLDGLDPSFLPPAIELELPALGAAGAIAGPLVERLQRFPEVAAAAVSRPDERAGDRLLFFGRSAIQLLAIFVLLMALLIALAAGVAALRASSEERHARALAGGTASHQLAPALLLGALDAAFALALAALVCCALHPMFASRLATPDLTGVPRATSQTLGLWLAAGAFAALWGTGLATLGFMHDAA